LYARSTKSSFCDISDDERMTPNSLSRSVPDGNDNLKGPSARAFPEQDHADSADHDQKVENKIAMVHVIQIVCQLLSRVLDGGAVGVVHLRPPGDAGPDVMSVGVEWEDLAQLIDEVRALWPRADQAHFAAQYVDDLRNLVNASVADQGADAGHPRVTLSRPDRCTASLSVDPHRS